jgi:hypothetical protein
MIQAEATVAYWRLRLRLVAAVTVGLHASAITQRVKPILAAELIDSSIVTVENVPLVIKAREGVVNHDRHS